MFRVPKEKKMPYINIRVAGKLTKKQKENICRKVTDALVTEANKPPESILIFIDEVEHENIAKGGILLQAPK
jgi:4-oxalocrotonate tautomerase